MDEGGRAPTFRCFNIFSDISMSDISQTDSRDSVENYCSSFHPRTGKQSKRRKDLRRGKRQRDGCEGGGGCSRMDRKNERKEEENHARSQSQERKTITMATASEKHMMQRREGETKQKGGVSHSAGRQQRREE
ncbi:hypothetical protein ATANTOWER_002152 [Ataeniobius toweri]|uniref:Uncharacterized protein n=1 Tax=Ataeniobius toweri TaxID=208326 RepID=A0ABU7A4G4_9TELE|nr:hypothetical protein [Ataeniobius toweri]